MPIINVKMTEEDGGATLEQKEKLHKGMAKLFDDIFGRGGKTAVVTIEEISTDNYSVGGKTITEVRKEARELSK